MGNVVAQCYSVVKTAQGSWPLKMGTIGWPEMSVRNYHYLLRNSPEERSSHQPRGGSLGYTYFLHDSVVIQRPEAT